LLGAVFSILFMIISGAALRATEFTTSPEGVRPAEEIRMIGLGLLDRSGAGYLLPFEVISLLLLVAVIGGTVIARKTPPRNQPFTTGGDHIGETISEQVRQQDGDSNGEFGQ
jgi:hypothetical protein